MTARFRDDLVVVIDEFSYWVRVDPRVLSELQYFMDEYMMDTRFMIIVIGSIYTIMVRDVLSGSSPLYGRARYRIHLRELAPWYVKEFLPKYKAVDRVRIYAVFGGIPYYLRLVNQDKRLEENLYESLNAPYAPVRYEKEIMLREEFREIHTYSMVLSAIARGYYTPSKIADVASIDRGYVAKYLSILETLGYVEKIKPLFMKRAKKYRIRDPILRTWYYLVDPVYDLVEAEAYEQALKQILEHLDKYTSQIYEYIVEKILTRRFIGQGYILHGKVVYKGEEIDLVYINPTTKQVIPIEIKWRDLGKRECVRELHRLEGKAERILKRYRIEKPLLVIRNYEDRDKPENILSLKRLRYLRPGTLAWNTGDRLLNSIERPKCFYCIYGFLS